MTLVRPRYLVTGASSGIGQATAQALAAAGAQVTLVARDPARLAGVRDALPGDGHAAEPFDLADAAAIAPWLKGLAARLGPFDGLAHCAGIQRYMALRFLDVAAVELLFRTNVLSALALLQGLRQKPVRATAASAVLVSSVMGQAGAPLQAAYGATKGALDALVRSAALELAPEGIRVNAVAPGLVRTPMSEEMLRALPEAQAVAVEAAHPLGLGRPEDVAAAIAWLLGPGARWVTGTTLVVDGGYLAR